MLKRSAKLPLKQLKSYLHASKEKQHVDNKHITLVDFMLPSKGNEVLQNLVNDEIIASSIIGKFELV